MIGTAGVGFDDEMSFPDVALNTVCAAKAPCKNGGEFDSSCNCRCDSAALWGGADCGTCSSQCLNGGSLNAATCTCSCPSGFFGNMCQAYVLIRWKAISGTTGTINVAWSLENANSGSYFIRMAAPQGVSGSDIGISGSTVTITGQTGSKDISVNVLSYIPGYPAGWHYVFMNSLGQNEFGASRGFTTIALPSLNYDSSAKCLSGGHAPITRFTGICASASWATPAPVVASPTSAPVAGPATLAPTAAPVAPPTAAPVAPAGACVDSTDTGFTINGAPATCTQLAGYCADATHGASVSSSCPATCKKCAAASTTAPTLATSAPVTAVPTAAPTQPPTRAPTAAPTAGAR